MPFPRIETSRRFAAGAEVVEGGVHFRAWAPACRSLSVALLGAGETPMAPEAGGWFSAFVPGLGAGALYRLRLDGGDLLPDPASRFQPEGPHGPSEVIDPAAFRWTDGGWKGLTLPGQVLYELHLGTFSPEGTWAGASARLPELARLGVTAVEVMPVAETPGAFNWGYDGVDLYAPASRYGRPEDFRAFVDHAHALGLGVLLDVVYNHFGPDGNYLTRFSPSYLSREATEWGEAVNYDGPGSEGVRTFLTDNAACWVAEYHLDGLRFDATQNIYDRSPRHVLAEFAEKARRAAGRRRIVLVAENETQDTRLLREHGFDAVWNDDFHHAMRVALTGRRPAYFTDYKGAPQELVAAAKRGYLYQGQRYSWQKKGRGTSTAGVPAAAFVTYLENHDQVANSMADGLRLVDLAAAARLRAATAFWLLSPGTPLFFQGQERGVRTPFLFFADHRPGLREDVAKGRRGLMSQLPELAAETDRLRVPDPADRETFERCRLDWSGGPQQDRWAALHRDLLALRRHEAAIAAQDAARLDGAPLGPEALCLRWTADRPEEDRLLLLNLGTELRMEVLPEPLLAPPARARWTTLWHSEDPRYGGRGLPELDQAAWVLHAQTARLLRPEAETADAGA